MPERWTRRADLALVFVLALTTRLVMIVDSPGGISGIFGYDAGVYYAAADAFVHGRLPYRSFVLLHPPGVMLFLSPFATLGRLTRDHIGFQVAVLAYTVMSSVGAVLIVLIGRRLGLSRLGCLAGGAFFGVWFGTVTVDYAPRLEGLGTFLFLLGSYLVVRGGRRSTLWAGVAVGATVTVKIWWILPLALMVGWLVRTDRFRAKRFGVAAAITVLLVCGPFLVAAPSAMWRMVVESQAIRANGNTVQGHLLRINRFSSATFAVPTLRGIAAGVVLVLTVALLVAVFGAAWRGGRGRIFVVVAAAQIGLLVAEPSYLSYYSGYAAGALALAVAAAVGGAERRRSRWAVRGPGLATVLLAGALTASGLYRAGNTGITRFPDLAQGRRVAATERCVIADSPMAQIDLDALSRGLADGCPNWVDVSGVSHVLDVAVGHETARVPNRRWQSVIGAYLRSGDAEITIREQTGLSPATKAALDRYPVLARLGPYTLRDVDHSPRAPDGTRGSLGR